MRRALRSVALAGITVVGGLMGIGTSTANAQGFGGFYGGYGGGYPGGAYGPSYGVGVAVYPAAPYRAGTVVPQFGYGGFGGPAAYGGISGGYGRGYGGGYAGSLYSPHHHRHHHGCGHRY